MIVVSYGGTTIAIYNPDYLCFWGIDYLRCQVWIVPGTITEWSGD